MSIGGSILDRTVILDSLESTKIKQTPLFFCLISSIFSFFHKQLILIESNGKDPCSIFQWAEKTEKVENNVAFISYNKIDSFLSISKTAKKLTKRVVFKILLILK